MKVIIYHDVDHWYWSEHIFKDLFIQKTIAKQFVWFTKGYIGRDALTAMLGDLFRKRLHRVPEIMAVNNEFGAKPTFFVGMNNGLGLSYPYSTAQTIVEYLYSLKVGVGVHGIEFNNEEGIVKEYKRFEEISNGRPFGMRMHYLRNVPETFGLLSKAGYLFDSTELAMKAPYKIGNMTEFPVSLMEATFAIKSGLNPDKMLDYSRKSLEEGMRLNLPVFPVIFHDLYYTDAYPGLKKWYYHFLKMVDSYGLHHTSFHDYLSTTA